jgi:hypothetical protein
MGDQAENDRVIRSERGAPLVATWLRWAAVVVVEIVAVIGIAYAYVSVAHSGRTLASLDAWIIFASVAIALMAFGLLRAEESHLQRELRTARTGTAIIRDMVVRRRQRLPIFLRVLTTHIGTAAVLLADGERAAALDAISGPSPFMTTGRLRRLREVVEADADRASGSIAGVSRAIERLRASSPIGNTEADRYRAHVLVKATLQQTDPAVAQAVLDEVSAATDEEIRLYAVWLRVWFDDADAGKLSEPELRMAALLARTHGAEELVRKLEERIAKLAPSAAGE